MHTVVILQIRGGFITNYNLIKFVACNEERFVLHITVVMLGTLSITITINAFH